MMRYRYDTDADALYVTWSDAIVDRTVLLPDCGILVDLDASGRLVGLEVLHPDRPWPVSAIRDAVGVSWSEFRVDLESVFGVTESRPYPTTSVLGFDQRLLAGA